MADLRARAKELAEWVCAPNEVTQCDIGLVLTAFEAIRSEQIEADARIAERLVHPMNDGPNMTARQIATAIRGQEKKG